MEVFANRIQVREVGCERNVFGANPGRRLTTPPLVVVDQVIGVGQTIQLREEIEMVKVRAAMNDEHGPAGADVSRVQLGGADSYASLVGWDLPRLRSGLRLLRDT